MEAPIEQHQSDPLDVPYFFTLERYDQCRALESLIFASDDPLTTRVMHRILVLEDPTQEVPGQQPLPLDGTEATEPERPSFDVKLSYFDDLVDEINLDLERTDRPFRIVKIAGGYQFATTPQHGQLVQRLLRAKSRKRLTQAAIETLAIIAYRQPITKTEIEAIRGVNAGEVVNSLVEKQLVAMVGRSETPGKPLLYGTTDEFLRIFGLNALSDLPKLREIDELLKTTTTLVDMDDTMVARTDHKTLRKQIAALLEHRGEGAVANETGADAPSDATSGAYWHREQGESETATAVDSATATGEDSATAPGEDSATTTGEDSATAPGEDSATTTSEDSETATGEDSATAPGEDSATETPAAHDVSEGENPVMPNNDADADSEHR